VEESLALWVQAVQLQGAAVVSQERAAAARPDRAERVVRARAVSRVRRAVPALRVLAERAALREPVAAVRVALAEPVARAVQRVRVVPVDSRAG
jgi:hypothetical protein